MNMFDSLEVARDLVRRDEVDRLFDVIRQIQKNVEADPDGWHDPVAGTDPDPDASYTRGVIRGMEIVLNELDERMGYLRDRWIG